MMPAIIEMLHQQSRILHRENLMPQSEPHGYSPTMLGQDAPLLKICTAPIEAGAALRRSLLASVLIHALIIGAFSVRSPEPRLIRKPSLIQAHLLPTPTTSKIAPREEPSPPEPAAPTTGVSSARTPAHEGTVTEKAVFIVPPDLSILESIPVIASGSITLRLHVSALGTVGRVEVLRSDPVPRDLMDGLLDAMGQTKLSPARRADGSAAASQIDLVIRVDPGAQVLGQ
jgi:hypothetical protein